MRGEALLVTEHAVFRQALALVLEWHANFRAIHAGSLAEARQRLAVLDAEHPDLAIVDLELPNDDAVELIRHIREANPRTPVLVLTTGRDPKRAARAREVGAAEVLTMAASSQELLEGVKRIERR